MTEEEAVAYRCIVFDTDDLIRAFSETVYETHRRLSAGSKCFDPLRDASLEKYEEIIGKISSVTNACFGIIFGSYPESRYGGDLFVQVSSFCEMLAKDHIFPDGNKRTALVMTLVALSLRGIRVRLSDADKPQANQFYRWIQDVVSGARTTSQLARELRDSSFSVIDERFG